LQRYYFQIKQQDAFYHCGIVLLYKKTHSILIFGFWGGLFVPGPIVNYYDGFAGREEGVFLDGEDDGFSARENAGFAGWSKGPARRL
jgi:hypothetical protein